MKQAKIAISTLNKIYEAEKKSVTIVKYSYGEESIEIQVKPFLSLEEAAKFVNEVAKECVDCQDARYTPEIIEYAFQYYTILYYTNITLSNDHHKNYRIITETEIYNEIAKHINRKQYNDLVDAVYHKIEYTLQKIYKKSKLDELWESVTNFINKLDDGFDWNLIKDMLPKLANLELDENTLVEALINKGVISNDEKESENKVIDLPLVGQLDFEGNEVTNND